MDLNNIPVEEILERFIRNDPEMEEEIRHMFGDLHGIVEPRESSLPWLRRVKESGRRILFLSNYSHKIMRECADALYFLPEMEGGLFSCDVHMVKPDPGFFRLLIEKYQLDPARCVFIDDIETNLEGARAVGMHTILFEKSFLRIPRRQKPSWTGCWASKAEKEETGGLFVFARSK